ncbi:MAG: S8 family serine peptidase [Bacillota bacterium]
MQYLVTLGGQKVDLKDYEKQDPGGSQPRAYLVQFKPKNVNEDPRKWRDHGKDRIKTLENKQIPYGGFLDRENRLIPVYVTPEKVKSLRKSPLFYAVAYFRPQWKQRSEQGQNLLLRVTTFKGHEGEAIKKLQLQKYRLYDQVLLAPPVGTQLMNELAQLETVATVSIEPSPRSSWVNSSVVVGARTKERKLLLAKTTPLTGDKEMVAVCDRGLDSGDESNLRNFPLGTNPRWVVLSGNPNELQDGGEAGGHGTHVAGIIAHGPENDRRGVAPRASLLIQPERVDEFGSSLEAAYKSGARIHNDSWTTQWSYDETSKWSLGDERGKRAVRYDRNAVIADTFAHKHRDFVIVIGAANDGPMQGTLGGPAAAKNAITVGSCQNELGEQEGIGYRKYPVPPLNPDNLSEFSSRGPTDEGRIKPDVVAPGEGILSTMSQSIPQVMGMWGGVEGEYCYSNGTSMATPLVSGCVALLRQWLREVYKITDPSSALIKALLINGAVKLQAAGGWGSPHQGWGRVNLQNIITPQGRQVCWSDESAALSKGKSAFVTIDVVNDQPFKVTLVWRDPPATEAQERKEKALIHDLDLLVKGPKGDVLYVGNKFDDDRNCSLPVKGNQTDADRLNNVECVILDPADKASGFQSGTYTIEVLASEVTEKQPFALVVSGDFAAPPKTPILEMKLR